MTDVCLISHISPKLQLAAVASFAPARSAKSHRSFSRNAPITLRVRRTNLRRPASATNKRRPDFPARFFLDAEGVPAGAKQVGLG